MSAIPDPIRLTVTPAQAGRNCPYCRFALKSGVSGVECGACHAVHHAECWDENRGCAVMGCALAPSAAGQPSAVPPPAGPPPAVSPPAAPQPVAIQPHPPISTPSPSELTDQLRAWATTPAAAAIGTAAATIVGIMLLVGLAIAVLTPDRSLLGIAGSDAGIVKETLRDTVALTMARYGFESFGFPLLPFTFAIVPPLATAFAVRRHVGRLGDLPQRQRLVLAVLPAVLLAIAVATLGAFAGGDDVGFRTGSVVLFSLMWGVLGGLIAAARVGEGPVQYLPSALPAATRRWVGLAISALMPLAAVLAACGLIGVLSWEAQIIRGESAAVGGRAKATAIAETPFFIGQYAITFAALGTFAQFEPAVGEDGFSSAPIPPNDNGRLSGLAEKYRIVGFHRAIPFALYVFLLILLPGIVLLVGCYAGYATAVAARATSVGAAAVFGATTGLVWGLVLVALRAIAAERTIDGDSLFVATLLLTAAAGALGGALAGSRPKPAATG